MYMVLVPKWVKKSSCLDSVNPSITVTFHPEKSMIKAGKVCSNSDVKYIECHDPVSKKLKQKVNDTKKKKNEFLKIFQEERSVFSFMQNET